MLTAVLMVPDNTVLKSWTIPITEGFPPRDVYVLCEFNFLSGLEGGGKNENLIGRGRYVDSYMTHGLHKLCFAKTSPEGFRFCCTPQIHPQSRKER